MRFASRVFVTGASSYTCFGLGCQAFWNYLGTSTGRELEGPDQPLRRFPPLETSVGNNRKIRSDHRLTGYLLAAIEHDLGGFLQRLSDDQKEHFGVVLGSAYGHLSAYFSYYETGTKQGYQLVNPRHFPFTLPNCCAVSVSDAYSLWGSSTTICTGSAAGLEAIEYAADAIRRGDEKMMLAGAVEEINDYGQRVLNAVAPRSPFGPIHPFAQDLDGTIPGEGVAVLLLQSAQAAQDTGRTPMAEVCATVSTRGIRWDIPNACTKAVQTMRRSISLSGLRVDDIEAVFPSANGSQQGDEFEATLLRELFGERLHATSIFPVKRTTGECFAASALLQCLAAVYFLALAGQEERTPSGSPGGAKNPRLVDRVDSHATALVYSAGYDGTFAATVLRRPPAW